MPKQKQHITLGAREKSPWLPVVSITGFWYQRKPRLTQTTCDLLPKFMECLPNLHPYSQASKTIKNHVNQWEISPINLCCIPLKLSCSIQELSEKIEKFGNFRFELWAYWDWKSCCPMHFLVAQGNGNYGVVKVWSSSQAGQPCVSIQPASYLGQAAFQ